MPYYVPKGDRKLKFSRLNVGDAIRYSYRQRMIRVYRKNTQLAEFVFRFLRRRTFRDFCHAMIKVSGLDLALSETKRWNGDPTKVSQYDEIICTEGLRSRSNKKKK